MERKIFLVRKMLLIVVIFKQNFTLIVFIFPMRAKIILKLTKNKFNSYKNSSLVCLL